MARVLMDNFSPAQYDRFEAYRRHALPKSAVRKVRATHAGRKPKITTFAMFISLGYPASTWPTSIPASGTGRRRLLKSICR